MKLLAAVIIFLIGIQALCGQNTENTPIRFEASGGIGPHYGRTGGSLACYFFNLDKSHISLHGGIGSDLEIKEPIFAGALRYGYGTNDRLIIDFIYGYVYNEYIEEGHYDPELHKKIIDRAETEPIYKPVIMAGYQRITKWNITLTALLGVYYDKNNGDFSKDPEKIPIGITFSLGMGYML